VHHLLSKNPVLRFSVSATTRAKRDKETNGVDYYFLSVDAFREKIRDDEFIEWEEVYHNGFYGTLKSEIERIWKAAQVPVFDVDVEGGLKIKSMYGDNLLAVFVMPPSLKELKKRLHARETETEESLKARVAKSEYELTYAYRFDKVLINDDRHEAFTKAQQLIDEFLR